MKREITDDILDKGYGIYCRTQEEWNAICPIAGKGIITPSHYMKGDYDTIGLYSGDTAGWHRRDTFKLTFLASEFLEETEDIAQIFN